MEETPVEELLKSRQHLENVRSFMLVLLLLVAIAAIHLIWTCVSISSGTQALADRQEASSFIRDEELALRGYLLSGDANELTKLEYTQRALRELAGRSSSANRLVDVEDSWYVDYAQPLIRKRQELDAGRSTMAETLVLYLQLGASQERSRSQIIASEASNKFEVEKLRRDISRMVNVRVTIAVLIGLAAMLVALFGLRDVTALRQTA
jgi:CHASE3 domain sensor protein